MADSITLKCGFLGAGQMATALATAWIRGGLLRPVDVLAGDPYEAIRLRFAAETGAETTAINSDVCEFGDILVVAVKPQVIPTLLAEIAPLCNAETLVVSIAAGVSIAKLAEKLPTKTQIVRVMPNTPCLVGASATGIACGPTVTEANKQLVERLFRAVGKAFTISEKLIDAVTGLSGSGPAYGYLMIEALADGGVKMGLPRDTAMILAAQTLLGAAKMVLETGQHPGALKDAVCSPAGTTIAGMHELEKAGVRAALMNAVQAATMRSIELGK